MQETINKRFAAIMVVLIAVLFIPSISFATTYDDYADTITYTTDMEEEIEFDEDKFIDACDDLTGEDLDYVKFILPSSKYGTLYYNSDEVSSSKRYYADESPYLRKVTFLPEDDYEGTVTITYTGYNVDGDSYSGKVKINVGDDEDNDAADDLEFSIDSDETVEFDEDDFNDVCKDLNDEKLDFVKFTLPSSSAGTLYYEYTSKDNYYSKVTSTSKYYYDKSPSISDITFVPDEDYEGTVTIKYTGYDVEDESFSGRIKIKVEEGAGSSKVIDYSVDSDETVEFDEDDFGDLCDDLNDEELDYVNFTLPSSTQGTLYYNYDDGDYDSKVSASKDYYYDDTPDISKITFVPNKSFSGLCKIKFKGYDIDGDSFEGAVEITVKGNLRSANMITYTAKAGSAVFFKEEDFNNACKKLTNNNLDFVKFTQPSTSGGKLYYGYTSSSKYTSEVSSSAKYYYGGTPFILNVAYVPTGYTAGTTTIDYTGYDTEGSAYNGKVQISISGTGTVPSTTLKKSKYFKDVDEAYSWAVDYIDTLYTSGIIAGTTVDSTTKNFSPASKITRGEFMLMLFRALGLQTNSSSGNFSDVVKGSYYYDAVATAKALGIAQGSENKFYPNSSITREDTMVLALRAMNKSGKNVAAGDVSTLSAYSDSYVIDAYAKEPIAALIKAGIITGSDDNKIHPMENITRTEAAAIIYRIKYSY